MKSTRFVCQKYSYFVDINTSTENTSIIKFTAGGAMPFGRLRPFFAAFKYWKLGPIGVRFMPASTLPVDPTGLSYSEGASTVDPRDEFNVGLVRRTNGENCDFLAGQTSSRNAWYYSTMLDPRWSKFDLQRGYRIYATPRFWGLAQTKQTISQSIVDIPDAVDSATTPQPVVSGGNVNGMEFSSTGEGQLSFRSSNLIGGPIQNVIIQNSRPRMSWQPTDMYNNNLYGPNVLPEVDCITCILPQAYKTVHYYRVWITETVYFRSPVVLNPKIRVKDETVSGGITTTPMNVPIDRYVGPSGTASEIGSTPISAYRGNPVTGGYISTSNNLPEALQ